MAKNKVGIFYSGATDLTGKALSERLGISGGTDIPSGKSMVICWGPKTKDSVNFGKDVLVLNHPNNVRDNRNKLKALELMAAAGVSVAKFVGADKVKGSLDAKKLVLPLVGRTKFHQGGKGFWPCLTKNQVLNCKEAEYFQEYIDIKTEYRLHMFDGECIVAQCKKESDNKEQAFVESHTAKVQNAAERSKTQIDAKTAEFVLKRLAKQNGSADSLIRSHDRGWKLSQIKRSTLSADLVKQAGDAVKALGLNYGAVDCCIDHDGKAWVIEVNTGPSLSGTCLDRYVEKFEARIESHFNPKKVIGIQKAVKPSPAVSAPGNKTGSKRDALQERLNLVQKMVNVCDEDEAAVIDRVFAKMMAVDN